MTTTPTKPVPLWVSLPLVVVTIALVYGPSVGHPFAWTDHGEIVQGALVPTDSDELLRTLLNAKGKAKTTARSNHEQHAQNDSRYAYYRPVKAITYAVDHRIGSGQPWSFHLTNVLLHLATCLVILLLLRSWTGRRWPYLAEAIALAHAVHPLHVEAVAWVSARSDVLVAVFCLSACALVLRARTARRAWPYLLAAALSTILAAGSKETGVMGVPILIGLSLLVPDPNRPRRFRRAVVECWLPALAIAGYLIFRLLIIADIQIHALGNKPGLGIWTGLDLFGRNLLMSFVPIGRTVADTVEVLSGPSLLGLAGLLAWIAWLVFGMHLRKSQPLILWCALGWTLAILPVSQLVPLIHPRGDRYLYLPAVFAQITLVWVLFGLAGLASLRRFRWIGAGAGLLFLLGLGLMSNAALDDWQDERRLFARAVAGQPHCVECWNNLAYAEALAGRFPQAAAACRIGLGVDRVRYRGGYDGFSLRWILANSLLRMNRGAQAVPILEEIVIKAGPTAANLGVLAEAYLQAGRGAHALSTGELALQTHPDDEGLLRLVAAATRMESTGNYPLLFTFPEGCLAPGGP